MTQVKTKSSFILASASPRRRELLARAGLTFTCCPAEVDESPLPNETPEAAVRRLARDKAGVVAKRNPAALVLGADTLVVLDGRALGKPANLREARDMLRFLSGRTHSVMTGVALLRLAPALEISWMAETRVTFKPLTASVIEEYLRKVNTLDKAGAYAIQEHGDLIIAGIEGLLSNVIGLPVEEVLARLPAACSAGPA